MKKLLTTTYGRVAAMLIVVIICIAVKSIFDRVIPMQVLSAVKDGTLRSAPDGTLVLPWYWRFEAVTGDAYVWRLKGKTYVVFPQSANGEARFTGEMATDDNISVGTTSPCNNDQSCISVVAPQIAANPGGGAVTNITVFGQIAKDLYSVVNNAD